MTGPGRDQVLGDEFDPFVFGASQLDVWARGNGAAMAARWAAPDAAPFFDISVHYMAQDPIVVTRSSRFVTRFFGSEAVGDTLST